MFEYHLFWRLLSSAVGGTTLKENHLINLYVVYVRPCKTTMRSHRRAYAVHIAVSFIIIITN